MQSTIRKIAATAMAAALLVGIAPAANAQENLPVVKRGTVITAAKIIGANPYTSASKMKVKRNGKVVAKATARYKVRKPGRYVVTVKYTHNRTEIGTVPVNYLIHGDCRVATETLVADRTAFDAEYGWLDGQIDVRYTGTCAATAYDAEFNGQPVTWQDSWVGTEYMFTKWDGTTDRVATLLADNRNVIGDVDYRVTEFDLGNKPTTMPGNVTTVAETTVVKRFRVK